MRIQLERGQMTSQLYAKSLPLILYDDCPPSRISVRSAVYLSITSQKEARPCQKHESWTVRDHPFPHTYNATTMAYFLPSFFPTLLYDSKKMMHRAWRHGTLSVSSFVRYLPSCRIGRLAWLALFL